MGSRAMVFLRLLSVCVLLLDADGDLSAAEPFASTLDHLCSSILIRSYYHKRLLGTLCYGLLHNKSEQT